MSTDNSAQVPLQSDPNRQAVPSLRGYSYQIWRTIDQWLRLKSDDTLYIECAEDMDVVAADATTAIQVKDTEARISLASKDAREAILHFWQLRERTSYNIRFQFLTRGEIAIEKGDFFYRRPGIEVWKEAAKGDSASCEQLRNFLLHQYDGNTSFCSYLESCSSDELIANVFRPFEWITQEPDVEIIKKFIQRRLIQFGEGRGCSPSNSSNVLNDLYAYCWDVAQKIAPEERSLSREDFLLVFEKATSVLVPLNAWVTAVNPAQEKVGSMLVAGSLRFWTDGIPPLPLPTLPRELAVATASAALSPLAPLILASSSGKGKTTLAKLVALATKKDCLWIDLSGRENDFTEIALASLSLAVMDYSNQKLIVIDDFSIESTSPSGIWTSFGMLQRACKLSGSQLLITTKGIPRERLDARLIALGAQIQPIEDLSENEIKDFFEQLDCPTTLSAAWATLTRAQTNGHPKLVHVRGLDLQEKDWPQVIPESLAEIPASIAGQRENERLNIALRESGPRLTFLYHLTLLTLPFDRALALRLGSRISGLTDPGTALDSFLGRWLEYFIVPYYRVTSLLTNEASKVWSDKQLQEAHANIFDSFLEKNLIDIAQVLTVLLHAYNSQSATRLASYVKGLLANKDSNFHQIAKELRLIVYFGTGIGNRAIPFNAEISLLFRILQFKVATREEPEKLSRIADEWLWEIDNFPKAVDTDFIKASKAIWAGSVASVTEGNISAQVIVDAIVAHESLEAVGSMPSLPAAFRNASGATDVLAILFSFFQIRCKSIDYLDSLLDALVKVEPTLRARMLSVVEMPYFVEHTFIVEGAWIGEFKKENPDWNRAVQVLKRTMTLAKEWNLIHLGISSVKALSIVFDEHLNDRQAASNILSDGEKLFGGAALLDEQLANISFRHDDLSLALSIWEKILATEDVNQFNKVKDPFAFRKAAITAGKLGDYEQAFFLFYRGGEWATREGLTHTASGLLFDAAYAAYKCEHFDKMCEVMTRGFGELIGRPDPEGEFRRFALQKLAGYVVLWIRTSIVDGKIDEIEPVLGCCSNPDYDLGIKTLPRAPAELTFAHIVEIENRLSLTSATRKKFGSSLISM